MLNILIVTDGWQSPLSGSFDDDPAHDFSLFHLVEALDADPLIGDVVTAHRAQATYFGEAATAQIAGFRFAAAHETGEVAGGRLFSRYQEIWLFGVEPQYPAFGHERHQNLPPTHPGYVADPTVPTGHLLDDNEISALHHFAKLGGGIFATGDHEDLGYAMCGHVPRVRSMRDWWYQADVHFGDDPSVAASRAGEPAAPSGSSAKRHDTLVQPPAQERGPLATNTHWLFEWQSDGRPQVIEPVWTSDSQTFRPRPSGSHDLAGLFEYQVDFRFPHPLLCGPDGPITVLPDHPHEGNCRAPIDLSGTVTIDGVDVDEWPQAPNGTRPRPQIVANANVSAGHDTEPPPAIGGFLDGLVKPPTEGGSFPVIAAHDGHPTGFGRVVVDATWHHFFRTNVEVFAHAPAGSEAAAHWQHITRYYRNIAIWLSPPNDQIDWFVDTTIQLVRRPRVWESWRHGWHLPPPGTIGLDLWHIARLEHGPCVLIDAVTTLLRERFDFRDLIPWLAFELPPGIEPEPGPDPWDPISVTVFALGGAARAVLWHIVTELDGRHPTAHDDGIREVVSNGVAEGVAAYSTAVRAALKAASVSAKRRDKQFATKDKKATRR
jgi:hypothetical protein